MNNKKLNFSDIDNPVIIGMIIQLLRFPNHTRLLSTAESVFYNQAQRDVQYSIRSDRENLAECIFLAEIFMHDAKIHKDCIIRMKLSIKDTFSEIHKNIILQYLKAKSFFTKIFQKLPKK